MSATPVFIRIGEALRITGLPRSSFYAQVADGIMPSMLKIGPRAAAVPLHEIEAVQRLRLSGVDDAQVRALVSRLLSERNLAAPSEPAALVAAEELFEALSAIEGPLRRAIARVESFIAKYPGVAS